MIKKLVLLRHGQSVWNEENRFTGWTDVDLSQQAALNHIAHERRAATEKQIRGAVLNNQR